MAGVVSAGASEASPRGGLSVDAVRGLAASLVTPELVVVPVRHHSPACAWHVRGAVAEHAPSAVLVEGPTAFDALVPLLVDERAVMPLAVYSYATCSKGGGRAAAYYPFCDYSPELVALREATARGVPARFIDLDLVEQVAAEGAGEPSDDIDAAGEGADGADARPGAGRSLLAEHHYEHSSRLRALAERLGCRDEEDLWEHLIEADGHRVPFAEHVARVVAYCETARRDHTAEEMRRDGTAVREAEMVAHVREALAARGPGDGPVLVVVGGFHAVALPGLLADPPPRPRRRAGSARAGSALIRYSFERLERLNGYASGMTSPAWHQEVWSLLPGDGADDDPSDPRTAAALGVLLDVATELRDAHGMPLALPTVTAAFEQALRLAALRERRAPLRSDVLDAVTSCFVAGEVDVEGLRVLAAARRVLTGTAIGEVPPGTGTPPLVADALARLRAHGLSVNTSDRRTTHLDLYRREAHRATSRLLHGLALLGVPFARRTAGPDFVHHHGLDRLQERWDYAWSPAVEGALVEASIDGDTVADAVAARFEAAVGTLREGADRSSAVAATGLLAQACVLGLHDAVVPATALVHEAVAADPAFDAVALAAGRLAGLWLAREPLGARVLDALPRLVADSYARALYLARDAAAPDPVAAVTALGRLRDLLVSEAGEHLDPDLLWDVVARLAAGHESGVVRGGALGLAYSAGRAAPEELGAAITGHLSGSVEPADAVAFLRGILLTAREAAWQEHDLLARLDARLAAWDPDTFVAHLPELRLAFASMSPAETDRVAQAVAGLHGARDLGTLVLRDLDEATVQRHLLASRTAARLLADDGLADWVAS